MGNEEGVTMGVRAVMRVVISKEGGDRLRVHGVVKVTMIRSVGVSQYECKG